MPNTPSLCYIEIPSPDIETASTFYNEIFGWKMEVSSLTEKPYTMFKIGDGEGNSIMAALDPSKKPSMDRGVLIYIKVEDISKMLHQIVVKGGKIVNPKSEIGGGFGYSAVFTDPCGNQVGLWSNV